MLDKLINGKVIFVTGGTGSFGKAFARRLLEDYKPAKLILFSRDELKQSELQQKFPASKYPAVRFFLGDVRDRERLYRAMEGVNVVIHAAALKQVPACEYNPMEAVRTNILGGANIIDAAIDRGVQRVIALSTDKAVNPVNLYGATKLCADKVFVAANNYAGARNTRFAVVRYGNVVGSRGSVIPFFLQKRETGELPITDKRMTRFWITLPQAVDFVLTSLERMKGGEIFVPKIPSMNIMDLAKAIAPACKTKIVGIRPGEKLHELMVPDDEARNTIEYSDRYVILPSAHDWSEDGEYAALRRGAKQCPDGFRYSSDKNERWLTEKELRGMVDELVSSGAVNVD
ncbi:MAG: UDP-N-acetylglucosamine 4,6-dehydratase (inverting) [Elusimicrobia bacterium]|nr:UDP-N-acetylglucosamine 4,6-dehydratase (inverting) [Elusimicrobiota bacterium]